MSYSKKMNKPGDKFLKGDKEERGRSRQEWQMKAFRKSSQHVQRGLEENGNIGSD